MADESLRLRVEVENAPLRETAANIKMIKQQLLDLAPGSAEAEKLRATMNALSQTLATTTGTGKSFHETQGQMLTGLKELRNEGRLFNFAVLEMVRGLEGLATVATLFSGASAASEKQIKSVGTAMEQAIGAGLGLHFGLQAIGGSAAKLAGPVGIAVAALVGLADIIMENNKAIDELANDKLVRLKEGLIGTSPEDIQRKIASIKAEIGSLTAALSNLKGPAPLAFSPQWFASFPIDQFEKIVNPNLKDLMANKKAAEDLLALLMKRVEAEKDNAEVMRQMLVLQFAVGDIDLKTFTAKMTQAAALARSHDQKLLALQIERNVVDEQDKAEKTRIREAMIWEKELADLDKNLATDKAHFAKTEADREIMETRATFEAKMEYLERGRTDLLARIVSASTEARVELLQRVKQIDVDEENLTKDHNARMNALILQRLGGEPRETKEVAPSKAPDFIDQARRRLEVWGPLIDNIRTGFQGVGESIRVSILDKLIPATSLFQNFVRSVLDGLMSIIQRLLEMALLKFVMNILVPGSGSILGAADIAGGGGGGGSFGSAGMGGGLLSSAGSLATMNHSFAPMVIEVRGVSVTRGMDIIHSLEATRPVYRKMGGVL